MLLPDRVAQGIADGQVTRVYRRWSTPRAKPGGSQLTRFGVVAVDSVRPVYEADLTEADAKAAGELDLAALRRWLARRPDDTIFEVAVRHSGPDPRVALREVLAGEDELAALRTALDRMDARSATGPWTRFVLGWIRENPAVVSKELAKVLDRELQPLKVDIRRLKALGLTISLDVGYRLSPRGAAFLDWEYGAAEIPEPGRSASVFRSAGQVGDVDGRAGEELTPLG